MSNVDLSAELLDESTKLPAVLDGLLDSIDIPEIDDRAGTVRVGSLSQMSRKEAA